MYLSMQPIIAGRMVKGVWLEWDPVVNKQDWNIPWENLSWFQSTVQKVLLKFQVNNFGSPNFFFSPDFWNEN